MTKITFRKKRKQKSPEVIVTLPTGDECRFKDGKYSTDDPVQVAWLKKLGYQKAGSPRKKTTKGK